MWTSVQVHNLRYIWGLCNYKANLFTKAIRARVPAELQTVLIQEVEPTGISSSLKKYHHVEWKGRETVRQTCKGSKKGWDADGDGAARVEGNREEWAQGREKIKDTEEHDRSLHLFKSRPYMPLAAADIFSMD